jgi:hypothetical protein
MQIRRQSRHPQKFVWYFNAFCLPCFARIPICLCARGLAFSNLIEGLTVAGNKPRPGSSVPSHQEVRYHLLLRSGECAATICIARENGSLMLQTGQRVGSETDSGSCILERRVGTTPQPGKAFRLGFIHL